MLTARDIIDFSVTGDGHVAITTIAAANTSGEFAAFCIFNGGVTGNIHVAIALIAAANASAAVFAQSVFDLSIAGDVNRTVSVCTAADASAAGSIACARARGTANGFFDNGVTSDSDFAVSRSTAADACGLIAARGADSAAAYGNIGVASIAAAANACRTFSTDGCNVTTSDFDFARTYAVTTSTDTSTVLDAACGSQTASFIIVVLNGQLAAGHISFAVYGLVVFKGGVCTTTREFVVAIQLNRGIAAAGHAHGGFAASSLDVHILERDLDLIALIFGLDGHGVLL